MPERPIPTHYVPLAEKSRLCEAHGLCPFTDWEAAPVPFGRLSDAEKVRVTKWAKTHGGPVPSTVTLFRVRRSTLARRQPSQLDAFDAFDAARAA